MALNGFYIVIEPGADNPKEHAPVPAPDPPEGFVDNTVYRYRIDEDGNKVFIGTMDGFPEGWERPKQFREKGFKKQKEEVEEMPKKDIAFEAIVARAQEVAAERGISLYKASGIVAQETGLHRTTVYNHARAMLQTPSPEPDQAANQEPERAEAEPAENIITEKGCPFDEEAFNPNPPEDNDFTAEDDEPIPYTVTDYVADHYKIALEIVELLDRKRADYGTENIKKFGSYGVLVRVSDKVERLINLSKRNDKPNFESIEDSWRDIAGYAILALIELREGR